MDPRGRKRSQSSTLLSWLESTSQPEKRSRITDTQEDSTANDVTASSTDTRENVQTAADTSSWTASSTSSAIMAMATYNFDEITPPYDLGLVYNYVSQLSDLER